MKSNVGMMVKKRRKVKESLLAGREHEQAVGL
jgi:hypothetical protein